MVACDHGGKRGTLTIVLDLRLGEHEVGRRCVALRTRDEPSNVEDSNTDRDERASVLFPQSITTPMAVRSRFALCSIYAGSAYGYNVDRDCLHDVVSSVNTRKA